MKKHPAIPSFLTSMYFENEEEVEEDIKSIGKITSIDAIFGLGEALVSGLVNPDIYKEFAGDFMEIDILIMFQDIANMT